MPKSIRDGVAAFYRTLSAEDLEERAAANLRSRDPDAQERWSLAVDEQARRISTMSDEEAARMAKDLRL
jgi:hypothetical protein